MLPQKTPKALREQYRTTSSWRTRKETHEQYTYPQVDFAAWAMDLIDWRGDERVLDVGCGPGQHYKYIAQRWPSVQYYGVDFSFGMIAEHPNQESLARGNMERLPFPDNTFDIVMANHVMYLAPDVEAAILETQRVLKPGGIFVATTNSIQTMPQFRELFRRALLLVSPPGVSRSIQVPMPLHQRFALENGSRMLARRYFAVVRHDLPGTFVFDEVDPIMEYLESTRAVREPQLPENIMWDQVMLIMREQMTNLIATLQKLVVDKLTGVLIATDSGGFIQEFVEKKNSADE